MTLAGLPGFVKDPDPALYWSDNYVVLDFETTTVLKGTALDERNRIVLACWGRGGDVEHQFGGEYEQGALLEAVRGADFIVAHNAKFELGWLKRCGLDLRTVVVYDTQIGEYIRGGNRFNLVQLSLDNSLSRYGLAPKEGICSKMLKAGYCTTEMPESWLLSYCERDVRATEELFLKQREVLRERNLIHLQYQRCLVAPALADIEMNGMQLDAAQVDRKIVEMEDKYARKTAEFQEFMDGVNPASIKQKCEYVFDVLRFATPLDPRGRPMLTSKGQPSLAAPVVLRLRARTAKQREWIRHQAEWSDLHSDVTKYLRKFKLCCDEAGGVMRAQFNQCATRTHRLSSSGLLYKVQFQNLNRTFKPIFRARNEGWLMGEADGAQLEFRVAVHMGRDKQGLYDIRNDVDIHSYTASIIGCNRQDAKVHTFKPLYGGKSGTPEQRAYYNKFEEKYSAIAATQRAWANGVVNTKKMVTEYGLIHYWPDCRMSESGYIKYTTSIYNYPVQGFATAEIIPIALVCAWHRMKDMQSFLVNTVHDSIIAELHPEEADAWHTIAEQCLIQDVYDVLQVLYGISLTVPLGAGVMVGTHWANKEAKDGEVVYQAHEDLWLSAAKQENMV